VRDDNSHCYEGHYQGDEREMLKLLGGLPQRLQRAALAPILEQNERLVQRQEETLQRNSKALEQFAAAMSECAEQLARHTDAVKGIASASEELLDVVGQMNKMLQRVSVDDERDGQGKRTVVEGYHRVRGPGLSRRE